MADPWTVQEAKAKLSTLLALARAGEPQRIGVTDRCVIVSEAQWNAKSGATLGEWLVETAPRGEPIELPPRDSDRGDPFARQAIGAPKKRRRPHR